MTGQEAQQLTRQIMQDGQHHDYDLQAQCAYEQDTWIVKVHVAQHTFTIHNSSEWAQEFTGICEILELCKKYNIGQQERIVCIA